MTNISGTLALAAIFLISSCAQQGSTAETEVVKPAWANSVEKEVAALGAKNWIVVTERAYPTPNNKGVRVVMADAPLPEVLREVMDCIESEGHIWPKVYTMREFEHIKEDYAPGVTKLSKRRQKVLQDRKSQQLTKSTLNTLLEVAVKDYRVLLVKSNSSYPYSSVFMELDSGYWNGVSEDALRRGMQN